MGEEAYDIAVLAIKLQLHLGFILLEIFCAHGNPSDRTLKVLARHVFIHMPRRTVSPI
jgi:hypothetical protein